jgi:hypothetical protein
MDSSPYCGASSVACLAMEWVWFQDSGAKDKHLGAFATGSVLSRRTPIESNQLDSSRRELGYKPVFELIFLEGFALAFGEIPGSCRPDYRVGAGS